MHLNDIVGDFSVTFNYRFFVSKAEHGQNPQNNKYFGVKESNATEEIRIIHKKNCDSFFVQFTDGLILDVTKYKIEIGTDLAEKIPMFLVI